MKKSKKINKKLRRRIALIIVIIAIALIIKILIGLIFGSKEPSKITLLLDNNLVEIKNEIINENNTIYLSKEDVENLFDSNIYYNEAEKELITTYNKHIALLKIDEDFMVVNDSNCELEAPMIEKNDKVYLPFSEMGIVYDLEFEYSQENKRLIADSLSKEKKTAITLKNVNLKKNSNIFSRNIQKVAQGEYVSVIEDTSKKWFKVRTSLGNIGYIKKKRVSEPDLIRDNWDEEEINVAILEDASNMEKDYTKTSLSKDKQNVVIPKVFYVENDGEILDKTGSGTDSFEAYVGWAEANNIEIWATLGNSIDVSNSLLTYTDRNKIINALYQKLVEYQFSGVNVNFDKIDDVNSFNRFIIELTPRLKELGIKVAVTNNEIIDKDKLSKVVDLIIE